MFYKKTKNYDFNGDSKKNKCRDEVDTMIPEPTCKFGANQCSLNGVYMPPVSPLKFLVIFTLISIKTNLNFYNFKLF